MDKATGNHIRSLSDADLLRYSNAGTESRPPEALAFAREELSRRNVSPERSIKVEPKLGGSITPPSFCVREAMFLGPLGSFAFGAGIYLLSDHWEVSRSIILTVGCVAIGASVGVLVNWGLGSRKRAADTDRFALNVLRRSSWLWAGMACQLLLLFVLFHLRAFPRMDLATVVSAVLIVSVGGFLSYALAVWWGYRLRIAAWSVAGLSMVALGLFSCLDLFSRWRMTYTQSNLLFEVTVLPMVPSVFCGAFLGGWDVLSRHLSDRLWAKLAGGLLTAGIAAIAAAFTFAVLYVYMILLYAACFHR